MNRPASNPLTVIYLIGILYGTQLAANVHHTSELNHKENGIELKLLAAPNENTLHIAPYNNAVVSVSLKNDTDTQELKLTARKDHWEIELPKLKKAKGHTVFIETVGKPRLAGPPVLVKPANNGVVKLQAHTASAVGSRLRYEPQPEKSTLGFWTDEEDFAEWMFQVNKPGRYRVEILQGCGEGQSGSTIAVEIGDKQLKHKVKETGHFQTFERMKVGTLTIDSTEPQLLRLVALKKADRIIADVRSIELIPLN